MPQNYNTNTNNTSDESFLKSKRPEMRRYPQPASQRDNHVTDIIKLQNSLKSTYGPEIKKLVNPGKVGTMIDLDKSQFEKMYGVEKKQDFEKQKARKFDMINELNEKRFESINLLPDISTRNNVVSGYMSFEQQVSRE